MERRFEHIEAGASAPVTGCLGWIGLLRLVRVEVRVIWVALDGPERGEGSELRLVVAGGVAPSLARNSARFA